MFGIKTGFKKKMDRLFFSFPSKPQFPYQSKSKLALAIQLWAMEKKIAQEAKELFKYGNFLTGTNDVALQVWKKMLPYNPNNLGNWSIAKIPAQLLTRKLERELILQMIHLYRADGKDLEGYLTSGSTEGNIFSAWLGRTYLEKYVARENICLLRTDLTHYSVRKAADVVGVTQFIVPVNSMNWTIDIDRLEETIRNLIEKRFRGFLLPLTFGYTIGGTNDNYQKIVRLIRSIKREKKDTYFFLWIDAALSGMVLPFISKKFAPFSDSQTQTLTTDFHKSFGLPYPSGLILYRKSLRKLIEKDIPYLTERDNTLLGSRTGISAAAIWASIQYYGFNGFQKIIKDSLRKKKKFLRKISKRYNTIRIVSSKESLQAALLVTQPLPEEWSRRYGLSLIDYPITFENGMKRVLLYKLFFLPTF